MTLAEKLHSKYKNEVFTGNFAQSLPLGSGSVYQ
jgi:hypothetical protein